MIMRDHVTAKERLSGLLVNDTDYFCDKCENTIGHNDESFEVRYGFICKDCFESF